MTGRYLIYTPVDSFPDENRFDAAWHRITEICRSLYRDRLQYDLQLNLTHLRPHVLIIASGRPVARRMPASRHLVLPQPVPAQRCLERAQEAMWFLPEYQERRKDGAAYWAKHRDRYQELSGMPDEHLRAELDYWKELERLSRQRGLNADVDHVEYEVAA